MTRPLLCLATALCATFSQAQTHFYISDIVVNPQPATTADNITIDLIGNLSSTGAYIASATAEVTGSLVSITIFAADDGGLAVLVPHTETIAIGQLPPGNYTIAFTLNSFGVMDLAPPGQHDFIVTGDPCDNLDLLSVQWHAFSDTAIVVHVQNTNTTLELFDYPNFILFGAGGDTLAKETVSFFGIGQDSWHVLRVHDGATIPGTPFNGTLELWTLFTEEFACSWPLLIDLCPPGGCATLIPMVQNLGGALAIGTYYWTILDADLNSVSTGTFTMTDVMQYDADTICLPPGDYQMFCHAQQPPTGGNPVYSVGTEGWITGPSQQVSFDLPVPMPFRFYSNCISGTNGVRSPDTARLNVRQLGGTLAVRSMDGGPLGAVHLLDVQGRTIASLSSPADNVSFEVGGLGHGIYVVRVGNAAVRTLITMP